jgi:hypothetical protein
MTTQITTRGLNVSRSQEFIDEYGVKWVTPARVAEIWNERAEKEHGVTGRYTRFSVFQRREQFTRKSTPGGDLYLESEAWSKKLRPHPKPRPDVTGRSHQKANEP